MINALSNAELALQAHQKNIDSISQNISNISTPGYKSTRVQFSALVANQENSESNTQPLGLGVSSQETVALFSMGDMKYTGHPMDVGIQGRGLFEIELENGTLAYVRATSMKRLQDGTLGTAQGQRLSSNILVPSDISDIQIRGNGQLYGKLNSSEELIELGQLELSVFDSFEGLRAGSNGIWYRTEAAGNVDYVIPGEDGAGKLMQGFMEQSNVNMVSEMVSLMAAQRAYQLNSRVIQVSDQILETINNLTR